MSVVVRFAPSPTGYLHIGGARTALFNWLFAKHHGGKCLLRIEDTDRARSTDDAIRAIIEGLDWLGMDFDGDPISQFARRDRHAEVARQMVANGTAYYCYATAEELEAMREEAAAKGLPPRYDGRWRDRDPAEAPAGVAPTIRLKAPIMGETVIQDQVQGEVRVQNQQLDDMVLLRGDGTPTYMLAVVVDDHDMGITHVIRGDDHLTNTFRQYQIYQAMGWDVPVFAHIPMIHGPDGGKLSKRHGALGIEAYRDMGYLPEALCNYLVRLGWGHGDEELFSRDRLISLFDLPGIGRAPSKLDLAKLNYVNAHYLHQLDDAVLMPQAVHFAANALGHALDLEQKQMLARALPLLKPRAQTLVELGQSAILFLKEDAPAADEKASGILAQPETGKILSHILSQWPETDLTQEQIDALIKNAAEAVDMKPGKVMPVLRAACCGIMNSPPLQETLAILGSRIVRYRLQSAITAAGQMSGAA